MKLNPTLKIPLPDLEMIFVKGHQNEQYFMMGDDDNGDDDEKPAHKVSVFSFYMGKYPVTQRLYLEVMGENPSQFKGKMRPVERVSWHDAGKFITALNDKRSVREYLKAQGLENAEFRLPSEAEWEFAARGGIHGQGHKYSGSDDLKQVGWYRENSGMETKPVGLLLPNELGLYDMSGNVYEWCEDQWHSNYKNAPADGSAWVDSADKGASRVIRGGCYFNFAVYCRPAYRYNWHPDFRYDDVGFRVVLSLQSVG